MTSVSEMRPVCLMRWRVAVEHCKDKRMREGIAQAMFIAKSQEAWCCDSGSNDSQC